MTYRNLQQKLMRIRQYFPASLKRAARICYYFAIDTYRSITHTHKPMTPPAMTALLVGSGDFKAIGHGIKEHLLHTTDLQETSRILEIGCGYGRIAIPLIEVIKPPGFYDGTDVVKGAVDWCEHEITARHPHFRFHHSEIANPYANSGVGQDAATYSLPFETEAYDLVILTSVFSHMRPAEIRNYLSEIARVLSHGGYCYATYYLMNESSLNRVNNKEASQLFKYKHENFFSTHKTIPEQTIAVEEAMILSFYESAGLVIKEPIEYGSWANTKSNIHYQDLIIATKP